MAVKRARHGVGWGAAAGRASPWLATRPLARATRPCALSLHIRHYASHGLEKSRVSSGRRGRSGRRRIASCKAARARIFLPLST